MILNVVGNVAVGATDGKEGDNLQEEDTEERPLYGHDSYKDKRHRYDDQNDDDVYY